MKIIPAIDVLGGRCVRLTAGDYLTSVVYDSDPVDMARRLSDAGLKYLHLVDLDGARNNNVVNHHILKKIAVSTSLVIDFGGGIKTDSDIRIAFDCGASKIVAGTTAVTDPELFLTWLSDYGKDRIILAADSLDRRVRIKGWISDSGIDIIEYIAGYLAKGVEYVLCTDISRDGKMSGPSLQLYREILSSTDVRLIASGGITSAEDIEELKKTGCDGVIIGKAIYEGKISLKTLSRYA